MYFLKTLKSLEKNLKNQSIFNILFWESHVLSWQKFNDKFYIYIYIYISGVNQNEKKSKSFLFDV